MTTRVAERIDEAIAPASLNDVLERRAAEQSGDRAYVFVSDRGAEEAVLTFAGLAERASGVAAWLAQHGSPGDRALLTFPPGLDFIVAFFGCLLAGTIAVPMMPPRRVGARDSSSAIIADCAPRFVLTSGRLLAGRPDIVDRCRVLGLQCLAIDTVPSGPVSAKLGPLGRGHRGPAFIQYTSGSTSAPKGVMVTHRNLLANLEMIRHALGNTRRSAYVSWVPLYHDMGLVLNCLETLYLGSLGVLMAPATFMQRPLSWLRAISHYKAEVACAPNFAYDLCVDRFRPDQMEGVDLSGWKIALNGAEPVRAATLDRFSSAFAPYGFRCESLYPAYGMAEATLLISGGTRGAGATRLRVSRAALLTGAALPPSSDSDAQVIVGCGRSVGGRIAVVEPHTCQRLASHQIGEVWVSGPHVATGYWQNAEATTATFETELDGQERARWLRTGDLGFLDPSGELYITGRRKDVIIIRGMNHHPHDIEDTVQNCHPALRRSHGAAFAISERQDEERLVIVQEIERSFGGQTLDDVEGLIREAIADGHEISVGRIVLIRPGTLPKTTSGKIQRRLTRQLWLDGKLDAVN